MPKVVPVPNVAQPGFTGIPQVDQIQQVSTISNVPAPKDFPDPSEFLVSSPPSNVANTPIQPNISTPQAPSNLPTLNQNVPPIESSDIQQTPIPAFSQNGYEAPIQYFPPTSNIAPPSSNYQSYYQPPMPEINQHPPVTSQLSSGSGGPINTSTYQPYLAYGAPPSGFHQYSQPTTGNISE